MKRKSITEAAAGSRIPVVQFSASVCADIKVSQNDVTF